MRNANTVLAVTCLALGTALEAEQVAPPPVETRPSTVNVLPIPAPPPPKPVGKSRPVVPAGNPGTWVTNADYPLASLRAEQQGVTGFRLKVDPQGRPTACELTSSSGSPELDSTTCSLMMRRGRFVPALDVKGRPTAGTYSSRFRWVIPKYEGPRSLTPGSRIMSFVVETDGVATNCQLLVNGTEQSGSAASDPCDGKPRFTPLLDATGNPVRKKVTVTMKIETSDP